MFALCSLRQRSSVNKETRRQLPKWLLDLLDLCQEEMVLRGFTLETRRVYLAHIRRFYLDHGSGEVSGSTSRIPRVSDQDVRDWLLRAIRDGRSYSYTNQALSALRFLHSKVLRTQAPLAKIPRAKEKKALPVVLSQVEVRRFLQALDHPKYRAIAFLLYSGGLRVSEAARLKVRDIDADRGQIHIRQGKGRKDRYVMLSPLVLQVLRDYARLERPHDWLFPAAHRRDRHITSRTIQAQVQKAAEKAGIQKRVTPHVLRHTFATHLLEGGTDLRYIQELLGHTKITTTVVYTRVAKREARKIKSPVDRIFDPTDGSD